MSTRQNIISAVDSRLKTITTANGYNSNVGNNIFAWREEPLSDAELPGIVYRDLSNLKVEGYIGSFRWALKIEIQIFTDGQTAVEDTRKMIADVYKAIGIDTGWGGLAQYTEQPESDEMGVEHKEKKYAGASIKLSVIYDAPAWET